jgi:rifampicin phosphotransferase
VRNASPAPLLLDLPVSWLTSLDQVTASQLRQFGGKAASLARLAERGYRVPRSWVIGTGATREILLRESIGATLALDALPDVSRAIQARISNLQLPPGLFDEIEGKTRGWSRYAVRSSAVHEDGEAGSWAGILESRVDIGLAGVEDAIRQCLASLYSPASLLYAARQSLAPGDLSMAVIVQEFVDGEACGVGFSVDPVNHFANTVIIEANSRAANRATSGAAGASASPDHYTIEKTTGRILEARKGQHKHYALSRAAATEVARQVARMEREFGCAVDVEWTIKDDVFVPLQARCVTAQRAADAIVTDAPLCYRFWWLDSDAWWQFESGIRSFQTERDVAANQLSDVVYVREGGSSRCLIAAEDAMRLTEIGLELRSRAQFQRFEAESNRCLKSLHKTLRALDGLAGACLAPADIRVHLRAIDAAFMRCISLYRMCDPYVTSAVFDAAAQFIPSGELLDMIAPSDPTLAQEAEDWSKLTAQEFDDDLAWGHARKYPWLVPNQYRKDVILNAFRQKHRAPKGQRQRRAAAPADRYLQGAALPDPAREMLLNLRGLADLRLRLKCAFTSFDFHFVDLYQAIFRLTGVAPAELHARYAILDMINLLSCGRRPAAAAAVIGHFHGGRLNFVGAEHADAFWRGRIVSLDHEASHDESAGNEIRGTVANHGEISGRVHLLSCNDADKASQIRLRMRDGDLLVSEMIQLNVMDLVQRAGGLVTDEGGMLSHAAILAREMGIPCIVGTQRATQVLRDGDHVRIDTRDGSVRRIDP